jgi:hypothetical protein
VYPNWRYLIYFDECYVIISEGDEDELAEFPVYRSTECARVGSQIYVITVETETLFLKFKDEQG